MSLLRWSESVPLPEGGQLRTAEVPPGAWRVECDGLAGRCELECDGHVARQDSAFARTVLEVPHAPGPRELRLRARPLESEPAPRRPRPRWRTTLTGTQAVRWWRTPMLGRAPFLGPLPELLGPYRETWLVPAERPRLLSAVVRGEPESTGPLAPGERCAARIRVRLELAGRVTGAVRVRCAGAELPVGVTAQEADTLVEVDAVIPDLRPWWPHTLGEPVLHPLTVEVDGAAVLDTGLGVARVETELGVEPRIRVNGVEVHARGAVWTPVAAERWAGVDPTGDEADREHGLAELRAAVRRAADGGAVLLRVPGTTCYERPEFWAECARAGVLVWQDLMVANVDLPADAGLAAALRAELTRLLTDCGGGPGPVVVSGGSEILQQAEMTGTAAADVDTPLLDGAADGYGPSVADELGRLRPGTAFLPSSPWTPAGHGPAIRVGAGVAHYFGVGGYRRPLADVRGAGVRLAAESLAFAVPPVPWRVEQLFGGARVAGHDPAWKAGVPRDRLAGWDFEDVRDHYVRELYGLDPAAVRAVDPERYLDLGSAALATAVEEVLGWWRSPRSGCAGALVLASRDTVPGAGWGMTDVGGVPKCTWYAARRRWAPRALWVDDRGLDGLWVELHADRAPDPAATAELTVRSFGADGALLHTGAAGVTGSGPWSVDEVLGVCVDPGYALRFGPPSVAAVEALWEPSAPAPGEGAARTVWMPPPEVSALVPPAAARGGLRTELRQDDGVWWFEVCADAPAAHVVVDAPGYVPSDSWFHLVPSSPVLVRLDPVDQAGAPSRPPTATARQVARLRPW